MDLYFLEGKIAPQRKKDYGTIYHLQKWFAGGLYHVITGKVLTSPKEDPPSPPQNAEEISKIAVENKISSPKGANYLKIELDILHQFTNRQCRCKEIYNLIHCFSWNQTTGSGRHNE